jgi:hypothetical protein
MKANRKLSTSTQWAIAMAAIGLGVVATLIVANAFYHAGWRLWIVAIGWAGIIALATIFIKLRGSTGLGSRTMGPMGGQGGTHPGDGMHAGDGG